VFSLDGDSATVVASVEVTVQDDTKADATPTVKRNRFSADLVDVHGKWLVENLQQVAVDIS
jgi:Mce-associated membrane protein